MNQNGESGTNSSQTLCVDDYGIVNVCSESNSNAVLSGASDIAESSSGFVILSSSSDAALSSSSYAVWSSSYNTDWSSIAESIYATTGIIESSSSAIESSSSEGFVPTYVESVTDGNQHVYGAYAYGSQVWLERSLWESTITVGGGNIFYNSSKLDCGTALASCPAGYQVPSYEEWNTLIDFLATQYGSENVNTALKHPFLLEYDDYIVSTMTGNAVYSRLWLSDCSYLFVDIDLSDVYRSTSATVDGTALVRCLKD